MKKIEKIYPGGVYLIDLKGNVDPEFGLNHYAILMKTNKKDLYLAFPLTTSSNRSKEKYTFQMPNSIDNEYILLYQVKPVSKNRVIGKKQKDGKHIIISEEDCKTILKQYIEYINDLTENNIFSIKETYKNIENSKNRLALDCNTKISVLQNEKIDYNSPVINYEGGMLTYNLISTKKIGIKIIKYRVIDKYGQYIERDVNVEILPNNG